MKIQPRHHVAINLLLQGKSQADVATELGINPLTLHRWLQDHNFQKEYRDAVRHVFGAGLDRLQVVVKTAVATLEAALAAPKISDRVKAAAVLLTHALKAAELQDVDERLAAIEKTLGERNHSNGRLQNANWEN